MKRLLLLSALVFGLVFAPAARAQRTPFLTDDEIRTLSNEI